MSLFNAIDSAALLIGIALLFMAFSMDSRSSFEGGSFINEILIWIIGIALVVGSLLAKLVEMFIR